MRMIPRYLTATALACLLLAGCGGPGGGDGPDVDLGDSAGAPRRESELSPIEYLDQSVMHATKCEKDPERRRSSLIFSSLESGFAGAQRDPSRAFADKWEDVSEKLEGMYSKEAIACREIAPDAAVEELKRCDVALSVANYIAKADPKVQQTFARIPRSDAPADAKVESEGKGAKFVEKAKTMAKEASGKARWFLDKIKGAEGNGKWGWSLKK